MKARTTTTREGWIAAGIALLREGGEDELTIDRLAKRLRRTKGSFYHHFADIDALDLDGVEPMTHPTPIANVMRDDVEMPCLDRDEVLAAAPAAEDGRFRVPPIVGLED